MAKHNELGRWGEQVARDYLLAHGYAIDAVNTRIGGVEIDFIARKDDRLCFVEVKTRQSDFADPLLAIDTKKQRRMIHAADSYLQRSEVDLAPQFDIIVIIGSPDSYTLEYIPDAFYPGV